MKGFLSLVVCFISFLGVSAQDGGDVGGIIQGLLAQIQGGLADAGGVVGGNGLQDAIAGINDPDVAGNITQQIPPDLLALAEQLGAGNVGGIGNGGLGVGGLQAQLLQTILTQTVEDAVQELQDADVVLLPDGSGLAATALGVIQLDCYNDLVRYVTDLEGMMPYSLKMASSWGNPGVIFSGLFSGNLQSLGIMEQCIDVKKSQGTPLDGQYCTLNAPVVIEENIAVVKIGSCWPMTCSATDLKTVIETVVPDIRNTTDVYFNCVTNVLWSTGAIVTLCILAFFGLLVILGTTYDLAICDKNGDYKATAESEKTHSNPEQNHNDYEANLGNGKAAGGEPVYENKGFLNDADNANAHAPDGEDPSSDYKVSDENEADVQKEKDLNDARKETLDRLLRSFSAVRNSSKIFDCTQSSSCLSALNGIRVLSMFWVIFGHSNQIPYLFRMDNVLYAYNNYRTHYTFWAITNAIYAVDSFFFLSGLLLTYLTLKTLTKLDGKLNWGIFYFHRYWRITPLYMVVIAISTTLAIYMGTGPDKIELSDIAAQDCRDHWWTNLLYINNLYPFPGAIIGGQCLPWSWYLANDMQFFIISPLILFPLYKYWKAGIAMILALLLGSFGATSYLTIYWGLGFGYSGLYNNRTITEAEPNADIEYGKPYTRIPPYLVGMLQGFALYRFKGRKIKINKFVNIVMWVFSLSLCGAVIYGLEGTTSGVQPPQWLSVVYNTLSRFSFAVSLAWIVFACEMGYGGLINSFLSQNFWTPLSRLTFATYLIHPFLITTFVMTKRTMFHWTYLEITYFYIANVVVSYAAAFVLAIFIEGPTAEMEKALIGSGKKK